MTLHVQNAYVAAAVVLPVATAAAMMTQLLPKDKPY
jgi:hypothetical protein